MPRNLKERKREMSHKKAVPSLLKKGKDYWNPEGNFDTESIRYGGKNPVQEAPSSRKVLREKVYQGFYVK